MGSPGRALALVMLAAGCGAGAEDPPVRNVILISLDTVRRDHLSLHGYERETTPFLDAFAAECAVYDDAYSVASWTLTAHMTMLTGLTPGQHGVVEGDLTLSTELPLLAERLRAAGFQTFGFHYHGWTDPKHGFGRGFDVYTKHRNAEEAGEHVRAALAARDPERPFFLFVQLFDAHSRLTKTYYTPPPPFDRAFSEEAVDRLAGLDWKALKDAKTRLDAQHLEDAIALYDGGLLYLDSVLRDWIEGWRTEGLLDGTALAITADHGEGLQTRESTGGFWGHGGVYQEGLLVPLLIRYPNGWGAGRRFAETVGHVDLVPTFLDFLGLPPDPRLAGSSLLHERTADTMILADAKYGDRTIRVYVQGPWKVVLRDPPSRSMAFHLPTDPTESEPLSAAELERLTGQVRAAWDAQQASRRPVDAPPIPAVEKTPEEIQELEALGYAGE